MNIRILKRKPRRSNTCMTGKKVEQIFKGLGELRKRTRNIRGRRNFNLISLGTILMHISIAN